MSSSYRDIPDGPYSSPRQRMAEERRRQQTIDKAKQQSELLQRLEHERETQRVNDLTLFELWRTMDERMEMLVEIRDQLMPDDRDEPFSDELCDIIQQIADMNIICNDLYFAWLNYDRPEFRNTV